MALLAPHRLSRPRLHARRNRSLNSRNKRRTISATSGPASEGFQGAAATNLSADLASDNVLHHYFCRVAPVPAPPQPALRDNPVYRERTASGQRALAQQEVERRLSGRREAIACQVSRAISIRCSRLW